MNKSTNTHFYKDKPLFGLDIGFSSVKVMQLRPRKDDYELIGYGIGKLDATAIKDGEIVDPENIAKSVLDVFEHSLVGHITTKRVALNIPASRTFTRTMILPKIADSELAEAVRLEAEQYIPVPIDNLYLDYSVISKNEKEIELLAVAAPKRVVDTHMSLALLLGLEPVAFDTSIAAAGRLYQHQEENEDIPAVLIDFGAVSADITVHDRTSIVTGTIGCGGDIFTELIMKKLGVNHTEGHLIKTKYGISRSKKQLEIASVLEPEIEKLVKEVKRMIRYYEERSDTTKKIGQVITMGGGANMPGLTELLISKLRLPVRMCDPWRGLHMHKLLPPGEIEKSMYMTAAGLALLDPKEPFA